MISLGITMAVKTFQGSTMKYNLVRPRFGAFDERSPVNALVQLAPAINSSDVVLNARFEYFSESTIGKSGSAEIHIGHIKDEMTIGTVRLNNCGRVGGINMGADNIRLMDAQYCAVRGEAEVLLGTLEQAIVLKIQKENPIYLILDKSFLSGSAPNTANVAFVEKLLTEQFHNPPKASAPKP